MDYADMLLSPHQEKKKAEIVPGTDYAEMLLSGLPVGGTYQPTGEISTITAKPITKFVAGEEPGASFTAQMKASFADTPAGKIQAFASSRGIPTSEMTKRYRVGKGGEIEFKTDKGTWQREVWELPTAKIKNIAAETIAHPGTVLGIGGAAVGGIPGAVGGAMLGEVIRKTVGKTVYGEKIQPGIDLLDVGLNGIFALGGEMVSKTLGFGVNKYITRKAGVLIHAGEEIKRGILSPADHAKATYIKALSEMHGMELAPHQLYDKEGMTNLWKYLRKHPLTSDSIRVFEDELERSGTDAMEKFIEQMGGYTKGPYATGKGIQEVAEQIHGDLIQRRSKLAGKIYKKAYEESPEIDVKLIADWIDTQSKTAKGKVYDHLQKAKNLLLKPELPEELVPGHIISPITGKPAAPAQKGYETGLKQLHQVKMELDELAKSSFPDTESGYQKWIRRNYSDIRNQLRSKMEQASPEYIKANQKFAKLSKPIDRLRESIIGEIEDMAKDRQISKIPQKFLSPQSMPDEELLLEAKQVFQKKDPDLWRQMIGEYMRDAFESMRATQEGKIVNPLGKIHQTLWGNEKQRRLLWAAMEPGEFKAFSDLMTVFQRASVGTGKESMTAPFQAIESQLRGEMGGRIARLIESPRRTLTDWTVGKWNDIILSRKQAELLDALMSPEVLKKLSELKRLTPGSQKFMDEFGVLTSSIAKRTLEERP